jgi:serine/threonine-protein kinase
MSIRSGDVIDGKYRVGRMLGIGGMGIVFEAHHLELEVLRAIKIMQPTTGNNTGADRVDPHAAVRFLREARAAARIMSEHVAHVYDVGVLESGERYMVMEYLNGTDLERLVRKRGSLSAGKAVAYLLQACSGISEAHKLGIIHRDIKSSNLFLTENELIKVIDWGLAKQTLNDETGITQANHVVGSLAYMSPEQLDGGEIDARTDIWSLGVVLHELVTGKFPFTGATCGEIIHNILSKEPAATTWMSEVSPALDAIVRRCLQKDRSLRYASVDALARDLRSVVIPQPSMQGTLAMSPGGMPPQASLSDTSTSERPSNKHEQETALHRRRRDLSAETSQPAVRKSKPSTGARTPERDRRTSGSRAVLYALSAMALLVLFVYAFSKQASSSSGEAVATTEKSPTNDPNQPMTEPPKRAKGDEPTNPGSPPPELQPHLPESPLKQVPPPPPASHTDVPTGGTRHARRGPGAESHTILAPINKPGVEASPVQPSLPSSNIPRDPGTGGGSAARPPNLPDVGSGHDSPSIDRQYI